jgi:hypothetical protein
MCCLDADDEAWIPARHVSRRLRRHVLEILLELPASHPVSDDVQERKDARRRAIDDALFEVFEVAPSGSADIDNRRHAGPRRYDVGVHTVVAGVRAFLAGSGIHVCVNVDDTGCDEQSACVDDPRRTGRLDRRRDRRNLSAEDRDVANGADVIARIDNVPALQYQVVLDLRGSLDGHTQNRNDDP